MKTLRIFPENTYYTITLPGPRKGGRSHTSCFFVGKLAYMGWALFGLIISSENYEILSNNWAKQLKESIVRSKSKGDSKIEKFLDEIIKSDDKLLDHFDLGKIKFLTDKNTHP